MVQMCICVSMYGGCLVGKGHQWKWKWKWNCLVQDVGTKCRWKSGFGRLVEYIVWLRFSKLDGCFVWLWI